MDDRAERTLTLTRLIAAPVAKVWRAWSDPALLPKWYGPAGYSCTTSSIDLRAGGHWIFDMIGPDGKVWPNRHRYTLWAPAARIEFLMDDGIDGEPAAEVVVSMVAEGQGTRLIQLMTFPEAAMKQQAEAFGALELGQTTLAKLEAMAASLPG